MIVTTLKRHQFDTILRSLFTPSHQTIMPNVSNSVSVLIDAARGSFITLLPPVDSIQRVGAPINLADNGELQIDLVGGGGSGSWVTWDPAFPTIPGYVFITGAAPTAGQLPFDVRSFHIKRIGVQYFVYPGNSALEDLSRYDIPFGEGIDPTTRRYILKLNPVGGTTYANGPRVVYYTPAGSNTGPTNAIIDGVYCTTYTRTTIAACKTTVRTAVVNPDGSVVSGSPVGDRILFPSGTLRMVTDTNGETSIGDLNRICGVSLQFPTVLGTYDVSDMTNSALWNQKPCKFDFSAFRHPCASNFMQHQGRNEQFIAFVCLNVYQPNVSATMSFYGAVDLHRGLLFERCVGDGVGVSSSMGYKNFGYYGYPIASITSVGTTATVTLKPSAGATAMMELIELANDAGQPLLANIHYATGSTAGAYNTVADSAGMALTWVSTAALTFTYTMNSDAGGVAASGSPEMSFSSDNPPDVISGTDIVFNQCGFGYVGAPNGAHALGIFIAGAKRLRIYDHVNHHNGWPRNGSRAAVPWSATPTPNLVTSMTQSAGVLTVLTPTTSGLVVGKFINLAIGNSGAYNASFPITAINPGVSVTCTCDPNIPAYGGGAAITGYLVGNTLNVSSVTAPGVVKIGQVITGPGVTQVTITAGSGSTWTVGGSAQTVGSIGSPIAINCNSLWGDPQSNGFDLDVGDPPDLFSHGLYVSNQNSDIQIYDIVNSWDCCNQKLTGGPYIIKGWTDIRCPMSFIFSPMGNDDSEGGYSWPQGSTLVAEDMLQVFAADMTPTAGRGQAPWIPTSRVGTKISNALVMNRVNSFTTTYSGYQTSGVQFPNLGFPHGYRVEHSIMLNWGNSNVTQEATTKEFSHNITGDTSVLPEVVPATGTGSVVANLTNKLISNTPSAFQAATTTALALDVAHTFRLATPELAGVTPVGDGSGTDLATELAVFDYMLYNPGIRWNRKLQTHFRKSIGR